MPLYYYRCETCQETRKLLLKPEDTKAQQSCKTCGSAMTRAPKAPSSSVIETLDNGIMARRVERYKDIEELVEERSNKNYREPK